MRRQAWSQVSNRHRSCHVCYQIQQATPINVSHCGRVPVTLDLHIYTTCDSREVDSVVESASCYRRISNYYCKRRWWGPALSSCIYWSWGIRTFPTGHTTQTYPPPGQSPSLLHGVGRSSFPFDSPIYNIKRTGVDVYKIVIGRSVRVRSTG